MSTSPTLSAAEVGELVGRSGAWVRREINARMDTPDHVDHLRVGSSVRFEPDQAEAFVKSYRVKPKSTTTGDIDPLATQTARSRGRG